MGLGSSREAIWQLESDNDDRRIAFSSCATYAVYAIETEHMKTMTVYHQKRQDGAVRSGVDLNGERVLERFVSGRREPDSSLEWFVDVRFRGKALPTTPGAIRRWLLEQAEEVAAALDQMADGLRAGVDESGLRRPETRLSEKGLSMEIVCSTVKRLTGRDIARVLRGLKRSWKGLIESLHPFDAQLAA